MKKKIFKCFSRQTEKWLTLLFLCGYSTAHANIKTGYDNGLPQETGKGRIDNVSGSTVNTQIAVNTKTPEGDKVISCAVIKRGPAKSPEKWTGENLFASVLYLVSPADLQKGKYYRVSLWIKSSEPTPLLLTFKDKTGNPAWIGKTGTLKTEINSEWRKITISFASNNDWKASELFAQIWFGLLPAGQTIWVGPLEMEELPTHHPLDLSAAANMSFKDEVAGDGKGGWSDQGPENDLRDFDVNRNRFEGIEFKIVNPELNQGRAVLTFNGPQCKTALNEAKLATGSEVPSVRYLYLLHTTCWNQLAKGTPVGNVTFQLADGSTVKKEIRTGIEVADWWGATGLPNGKVVYKKINGTTAVGIYLSRIEIASTISPIREVVLTGAGNAIWIVVGATLSNYTLDMALPENRIFQADKEWKAADLSEIRIKGGSALDLTTVTEPGPAGKYGRTIVAPDGSLSFAKAPDKSVRLTGFVQAYWDTRALFEYTLPGSTPKQDIASFAEQVRRHGYNAIRLHCLWDEFIMNDATTDGVPNPAKLDMLYYLISELKKNGVYIYLDIAGYQLGYRKYPIPNMWMKAAMMIGDEEIRRRWQGCAELMKQTNPHTEMSLIDDPAILCVNFYNEQATGVKIMLTNQVTKLNPRYLTAYQQKWAKWRNIADDRAAIPNLYADTPEAAEFHHFLSALSLDNLLWCDHQTRELGFKGLNTMYNSNPDLGCSAVRWQGSQIVSTNSYHAHPSDDQRNGSRIEQLSSVENSALTWCYANGWRFQDRPLFVSELNHCFWNRYRHEGGLLYPAYSALNRFSGLFWHSGAVDLTVNDKWPRGNGIGVFSVANSPVSRANAFLSVCLFGRGDVRPAPHRVELEITDDYLKQNSRSTTNSVQRRIGLMTNFSIAFPGLKPAPGVGTPKPADIRLRPDVGSQVVDGTWFSTSKEAKNSKFSLDAFVKEMKAKGILPADNISAPSAGVYQSETGEITMRVKEKLIKVVTPKTEAVSLLAGKSEQLGRLRVDNSSINSMIAATSVDGKALADSHRMVLLYVTEEANTGMEVSHDHSIIYQRGKGPVLLRCGKFVATLTHTQADRLHLYALGFDGSRREKLPLTAKDGILTIRIDTATLKDGPTPFFELVAE